MPSIRESVADNLLDTCVCGGLDEVYGANKAKITDGSGKTYWAISFCRSKILDGEIRVYSEKYIVIRWQTAIRDLPRRAHESFKTEDAAKKQLLKFVAR